MAAHGAYVHGPHRHPLASQMRRRYKLEHLQQATKRLLCRKQLLRSMDAGSEMLLLAAAAQVLASTVALLVPARPCALAATALAALTAYRASAVLLALAACHGHVHARGAHALHFALALAALLAALLVAVVVAAH